MYLTKGWTPHVTFNLDLLAPMCHYLCLISEFIQIDTRNFYLVLIKNPSTQLIPLNVKNICRNFFLLTCKLFFKIKNTEKFSEIK